MNDISTQPLALILPCEEPINDDRKNVIDPNPCQTLRLVREIGTVNICPENEPDWLKTIDESMIFDLPTGESELSNVVYLIPNEGVQNERPC